MIKIFLIFLLFSNNILASVNKPKREPQQVGGDIGMKYIRAEQLTFRKGDVGSEISFTGKEANSLYNTLPEIADSDSRGFIAQGQKKAVYFTCVKKSEDPICSIKIGFVPQNQNRSKWVQPTN